MPPCRNLAAGPNKTDDQGVVPQQLLFDKNFSTSTTVQNVLPYIGVSDSGHAEDRFPTRLMDTPNRYCSLIYVLIDAFQVQICRKTSMYHHSPDW